MNDRNQKIEYYENMVIGNNAVKLEPKTQPVKTKVKVKPKKNLYRSQPKYNINYSRINTLCTIVLAFVIIATLGICVLFLRTQYAVNQTNVAIEEKREALNKLQMENDQLEQELTESIDLDYVYEEATTRLGMRLPGPDEVYYVETEPSSYTTKYKEIEIVEENTTLANVLAYIARGW